PSFCVANNGLKMMMKTNSVISEYSPILRKLQSEIKLYPNKQEKVLVVTSLFILYHSTPTFFTNSTLEQHCLRDDDIIQMLKYPLKNLEEYSFPLKSYTNYNVSEVY